MLELFSVCGLAVDTLTHICVSTFCEFTFMNVFPCIRCCCVINTLRNAHFGLNQGHCRCSQKVVTVDQVLAHFCDRSGDHKSMLLCMIACAWVFACVLPCLRVGVYACVCVIVLVYACVLVWVCVCA